MSAALRLRDGTTRPLALDAWRARATSDEVALLRTMGGPVLDLGCGPGRLVVALTELGTPALGVDASLNAVLQAAYRGAPALRYSIFDMLPGEGRWATVLLFDGNIGIGGDPTGLLRRVADLLAPDGRAVVEIETAAATTVSTQACLERDGHRTSWFPWAIVAIDAIESVAHAAGLRHERIEQVGDRSFAMLRKAGRRAA